MPSFAPIVGDQPRILILGSMPSVTSLDKQQYYAHPRNAFWWLISELLQVPLQVDYAARVEQLELAGIAVWDVLYDCQRPGSLDSSIVRSSERANNIAGLLSDYPSIQIIGFNGGAAKTIFQRHVSQIGTSGTLPKQIQLPSTSPAHASVSKLAKLDIWRSALGPALAR